MSIEDQIRFCEAELRFLNEAIEGIELFHPITRENIQNEKRAYESILQTLKKQKEVSA